MDGTLPKSHPPPLLKYLGRRLRKRILSHGNKFLTRLKTDKGMRAKILAMESKTNRRGLPLSIAFLTFFGRFFPSSLRIWILTSVKELNYDEAGTWDSLSFHLTDLGSLLISYQCLSGLES